MSLSPQRLVDGSRTPGVYRVVGRPAEISAALAQAGWRAVVVDASATVPDFYTRVAAALDFPAYFGRNLDALWDCLTDLTEPTALVLADWASLAVAQPDAWARLFSVLSERCEEAPAFAVVLS